MASLRDFQRDFDLGGVSHAGFDADLMGRLGRALQTTAARRQTQEGPVVFAREQGVAVVLRDGFVQGALLSGETVIDLGVCGAGEHESSLSGYGAKAGVFLSREEDDVTSAAIFLGGAPMTGEALGQLCGIEEEGCFGSGVGVLRLQRPLESEDSSHRTNVDGHAARSAAGNG